MALDRLGADRAQVKHHGKMRTLPGRSLRHGERIAGRELSVRSKVRCGVRRNHQVRLFIFGYRQAEVAPVDAEIVTGAVEQVLVARSCGEHIQLRGLIAAHDNLLTAVIDGNDGIDVEQERDLMGSAVGRARSPREIRDGPREHIDIVHHRRGEERKFQRDAALAELIARVGGRDGSRCLLHCRKRIRTAAHKAEWLAINARNAGDGLRGPGPMCGFRIREAVGCRPDAEVGVVHDERRCRRPLLGERRCGGKARKEEECDERSNGLHENLLWSAMPPAVEVPRNERRCKKIWSLAILLR